MLETMETEFYYVDLKETVNCIHEFQKSLISAPNYIYQRISGMKKDNEIYLREQNFKNVNISLSESEKVKHESYKFMANELIVKKIEIPIDSKIVDLSDKIIISRLDALQNFTNIQELKLCPYEIRVETVNVFHFIELHNRSFNHYLSHWEHMPNYLRFFKKRDLEGKTLNSLTKEELDYLSAWK